MTQKEEFLKLKSQEEYELKRERFIGLKVDKEIKAHMRKIFPKIRTYEHDRPGLCFDPPFPLRKKEKS